MDIKDGHHASSLRKAPEGYDSVHAVGSYAPNSTVTMKIDGKDVALHDSKEVSTGVPSSFERDEFLVYDEAQVRLRYVVTVKL
jgi:Poly(ADP-ribose) polymerase catalytic domain